MSRNMLLKFWPDPLELCSYPGPGLKAGVLSLELLQNPGGCEYNDGVLPLEPLAKLECEFSCCFADPELLPN